MLYVCYCIFSDRFWSGLRLSSGKIHLAMVTRATNGKAEQLKQKVWPQNIDETEKTTFWESKKLIILKSCKVLRNEYRDFNYSGETRWEMLYYISYNREYVEKPLGERFSGRNSPIFGSTIWVWNNKSKYYIWFLHMGPNQWIYGLASNSFMTQIVDVKTWHLNLNFILEICAPKNPREFTTYSLFHFHRRR